MVQCASVRFTGFADGALLPGMEFKKMAGYDNAGSNVMKSGSLLGRQDSNLRMSAPKADALPLGDAPSIVKDHTVIGSDYTDK
jgi:hypothetical protein